MIKVIDIFAGPGGLGEGFEFFSLRGQKIFKIALSIEKDPFAHKTLRLRSFFRKLTLRQRKNLFHYYKSPGDLVMNEILKEEPKKWIESCDETWKWSLNLENRRETIRRIKRAIKSDKKWVLIGGPPCQAYSLVGRARRTKESKRQFYKDHRHTLYQEYLYILKRLKPTAFVMENVKGITSARLRGEKIFQKICNDLFKSGYNLYSLSGGKTKDEYGKWLPESFVVRSEEHGVPQSRHRVFIIGTRKTNKNSIGCIKSEKKQISVSEALRGIPVLRSRLSSRDNFKNWLSVRNIGLRMAGIRNKNSAPDFFGGPFVPVMQPRGSFMSDPDLSGFPNHESRSHLADDIKRYAYAACYAKKTGRSPSITEFPTQLRPKHKNLKLKNIPFVDRFKVQLPFRPSSTITSHISKDGHYYIHPDFLQARSLTVREAARLQTFSDNYFFEGPKTEQYKQVGNAVPPLLAAKIAKIIAGVLLDA